MTLAGAAGAKMEERARRASKGLEMEPGASADGDATVLFITNKPS